MLLWLRQTVYMTVRCQGYQKTEAIQYSRLVFHNTSHIVIVTGFGKTLRKGTLRKDQHAILAMYVFSTSGWSPNFVISMSNNLSCDHFDLPSLYSCRVQSPLLRAVNTPHACARGKVISHVVVVVSTYLKTEAPEWLVSTTIQSNLVKIGFSVLQIEGQYPWASPQLHDW